MKRTMTILAAALVAACLAGPAPADTFTFQPTSDVWNDALNWLNGNEEQGIPNSDDTAIIPNGKTCKIPTATTEDAKVLIVDSSGELHILGGGTLTLHGSATEFSSIKGKLRFLHVDGTGCQIDVCSPTAHAGVLHIENDLTISTSQGITGLIEVGCFNDSGCLNPGVISGESGVTLTIAATPTGWLTFKNDLRFDVQLDVDYVSFELDHADQVMEFNQQVDGRGRFLIDEGRFKWTPAWS